MKYKLIDETKELFGITLHRVQYENGEIGGWVEKESNLSQSGNAWVSGNADWMLVGPIGSRDGFTTIFREKSRIAVSCGCFYGSMDDFAKQVDETQRDNEHGKAYKSMIDMARIRFGIVAPSAPEAEA